MLCLTDCRIQLLNAYLKTYRWRFLHHFQTSQLSILGIGCGHGLQSLFTSLHFLCLAASSVQTGSKFLMDLSKDLGFVEGYTTQRLSKMLFLHFQNSNYHPGMLTWRSCHYIVILFHPHQHCYRTGTGLQTILSPAMISGELRAPSFSTPQALLNLKSPSLIPHIPKTFQCIEGRSG